MDLSKYKKVNIALRGFFTQALWFFVGDYLVQSRLIPFSSFKIFILRMFGSKIGTGCILKPSVKIKFPWKLQIGNYVWIGERVWIDNLESVRVGDNVCISQEAYFCTGSHHWGREDFKLIMKPIEVQNGVWVGAKALVGPGVTLKSGTVLTLGCVVTKSTESMMIYGGNPARPMKPRKQGDASEYK